MPPITIALDTETQTLVDQIERRQNDITAFQISRLRDCTGPLSLQQTLAAELREDVDRLHGQIEELELIAGDVSGPVQRRVRELVTHHSSLLAQTRKDMRAALLQSKHAIDAQSRDARAQLFAGRRAQSDSTKGTNTSDEAVLDASAQVTDALRRSMAIMQNELERSVLSTQMLKSSTSTLQSATTQHDMLTDLLGTSKTLVRALERSDWLDRVLIISALCFFGLVCAFILKQRIVDRSIRIAFFWTRFLPSGRGASLDALEKGSRVVSKTVATVAAAATSTVSAAVMARLSTTPSSSPTPSSDSEPVPTLVDTLADSISQPQPTTEPVDDLPGDELPAPDHIPLPKDEL